MVRHGKIVASPSGYGVCDEISHFFWPIEPNMGRLDKIAHDFTGYSCETLDFGAKWP